MTVRCPNCKTELDAPEEYVGQQVECPQCGKQFVVQKSATRIAVPTHQNNIDARNKRHSGWKKWILIAALIPVILITTVFVMVFLSSPSGTTQASHNRPALDIWYKQLSNTDTAHELHEMSLSCFAIRKWNPDEFKANDVFAYRINDALDEIPLRVQQLVKVGGLPAVLVKADMSAREKKLWDLKFKFDSTETDKKTIQELDEEIKSAREHFIIITPRNYIAGDTLSAAVYAYYGHHTYQTPLRSTNTVLLFAETGMTAQSASAIFAKREAAKEAERLKREKEEEEAEKREEEEDERKEREEEALAELKRPEIDGLFGVKFGDVIKGDDSRFKFLEENERSGCVYSYSMPKPFLHLDFCQVYTTPKTHKVFMIQGGITAASAGKVDGEAELANLRTIIKEKYKVEEDDDDEDVWSYLFRYKRQIIVYKGKLEMAAIDLELHETMQEETKAKKMQSLKSDIDTL